MSNNSDRWATDVVVSAPEARKRAVMVNFGGFAFTTGGIAHDISDDDIEELITPTYGDSDMRGGL